jgi:hypothetical protein
VASKPVPTREVWWSYLADYDGLLGSITIDLALKGRVPDTNFPTLVMTGVSYKSSDQKPELKMPELNDLNFLNWVSERRVEFVKAHSKAICVGAFLHDNQQIDYFYVADPRGLEEALKEIHRKHCPSRREFFKSGSDPGWKTYSEFLYPNKATRDHYRSELEKLGPL